MSSIVLFRELTQCHLVTAFREHRRSERVIRHPPGWKAVSTGSWWDPFSYFKIGILDKFFCMCAGWKRGMVCLGEWLSFDICKRRTCGTVWD